MKPIQELDLSGLHVLDGGMATELEARGCDLSGPLWSAHVLESSPETIAAVHRAYLDAGADCISTASYQISFEGYKESGRSPAEAANALRAAVAIAEEARAEYQASTPRKIWIAASLGPYGAALHNGAEYHGVYDCGFEDLVRFHRRRLEVVAETNADFVLFETIPSQEEARAVVAAVRQFPGLPASVAFTCRDASHVAHGEPLSDCARLLDREAQVVAIGVNCTHPDLILDLIGELSKSTVKPIFVYPNSGESWDAANHCWTGPSAAGSFRELARLWSQAGAQWVGGCCRTGPRQVEAIAQTFRPASLTHP